MAKEVGVPHSRDPLCSGNQVLRSSCDLLPVIARQLDHITADLLQFAGAIIGFYVLGESGDRIKEPIPGEVSTLDQVLEDTLAFGFRESEFVAGCLDNLDDIGASVDAVLLTAIEGINHLVESGWIKRAGYHVSHLAPECLIRFLAGLVGELAD